MADQDPFAQYLPSAKPAGEDPFAAYLPAKAEAALDAEQPGFFRRGWESIKSGASDIAHVAAQVPKQALDQAIHHPIDALANPLAITPEQRRETLRGVDSMVTLGYGQKAARAIEDTNFGRAMNRAMGHGGKPASMSAEQEAADVEAAPGFRTAGGAVGLALPGAASVIAKGAGRVVAPLTGAIGRTAEALAGRAATVPLVGKALGHAARAAGGAAQGAVGYEAAAPVITGASADAEGHRIEAAGEAATDPSGLLLSGAAGALPHVVAPAAKATGRAVKGYIEGAPDAAAEWLIKDLRGQHKGESTPTARKYLAADEADVAATLERHPDLKETLLDARHSDKKKLAAASEAVDAKIAEVNSPRTALYDRDVDGALDGGIRAGEFVQKLRDAAEEHRAGGTPGGHKMADWIEARAKDLERSRDWGGEVKRDLDPKSADDVKALQAVRANVKDPATAKQIDDQIGAIEKTGTQAIRFNPDAIVPTRTARAFVSDVQNAAFDGLGGLADTRAATQSRIIAGDAANILNGYLDQAATKVPEAVQQIRDINTQHSALKNIQRVIDQRLGKATENATGAGGHVPHTLAGAAAKIGGMTGGALLAGGGHPVVGGAMMAASALPEVKRFLDTRAAKFATSPQYRSAVNRMARAARGSRSLSDFTRAASAAGFPVADARRIYQAAHPDDEQIAEATP